MGVIFRLLSLVLIAVALMIMGGDIVTTLEKSGPITMRSFDEVWGLFSRTEPAAFKVWLDHTLPAPLSAWAGGALALPAGFVTGTIGVILAFLFGRRSGG